jgi:hypothetical protein
VLGSGLLSLKVQRVPGRPVRVRAPGLLLVLSVRIRRAPKGPRQVARGIKCPFHEVFSLKNCHHAKELPPRSRAGNHRLRRDDCHQFAERSARQFSPGANRIAHRLLARAFGQSLPTA